MGKPVQSLPKPEKCDICKRPLKGEEHVDGATQMGPWGNMCMWCYPVYGIGLGTGRGQKFDANMNKIAG